MMKTTDLGDGNDLAIRWRLYSPWSRGVPIQGQVWPHLMIIVQVIFYASGEMSLTEYDNLIKAFPTYRADYPFAIWILPGRPVGSDYFFNTHDLDHSSKRITIDRIPIAEKEARFAAVTGKCLDDLAFSPLCGWAWCHVEVDDTSSIMANDDEAKQKTEGDRVYYKEIACGCHVHMILEESAPCLRWRFLLVNPVFIDRGIGYVMSENKQFGFDPRYSPALIFLRHLADQPSQFRIDLWPTAWPPPGLPSPVKLESYFMPANHCIWLRDDQ
jgi:hypothetical protein